MPRGKLDERVVGLCMADLERRGMRRVEDGVLEMTLSPRFTGWIGLPAQVLDRTRGGAVLVTPRVGIREEEVSQLVRELRRLPPGHPAAEPHNLVMEDLNSLIPERGTMPIEWIAKGAEDAQGAARRIVEDIVFAGFPYMERMASPERFFEEFKSSHWRLVRPHEAAVTYMMRGDLEEAKRALSEIARPISHNPTSWAERDKPSVEFFNAFASHFGVDPGIEDWPIRASASSDSKSSRPSVNIQIRDRGVVPHAVALAGREELVASAVGLDDAQLTQIAELATKMAARGDAMDPGRAIGLAAIESQSG